MINKTVLFISDEYVKEQSIVMQNVEASFFRSSIFEAENIQFQDIICTEMYEKIVHQFEDYQEALSTGSTAPITTFVEPRFLDLLDDYGQEIILYYTLYHASYSFSTKVTNKGTVNQFSDESSEADRKMVDDMRKRWKNIAENYTMKISKYLMDNLELYPEYKNCVEGESCDTPSTGNNSSALYLGKNI